MCLDKGSNHVCFVSIEDIERAARKGVAEGIRRLRAGRVERSPGFDGEYGKITLLSPDEMDMLAGQTSLFGKEEKSLKKTRSRISASQREKKTAPTVEKDENASEDLLSGLNEEQRQAVTATEPAVAVIAGPGRARQRPSLPALPIWWNKWGCARNRSGR